MTQEKQNKDTWNVVLMSCYFFIPFFGLRIATENYLMDDDPGIAYSMLYGLAGGISIAIYMALLQHKTMKIKLMGLGVLLLMVIGVNLLVS